MRTVIAALLLLFFFNILSEERTYTISMMGNEIGKNTEKWTESKDFSGKCILTLESTSKMGITRGAYSVSMETRSVVKVTCKDFFPVSVESESSEMSSKMNSKAVNVNGFFSGEIEKNGNREPVSFTVPQNATFFSMIFRKFSENDFLKGGSAKIISEESLTLKNISYSAVKEPSGLLKVTVNYDGVPLSFFLDKDLVVRSDLQNGLISYKLDGYLKSPQTLPEQSGNADILVNTSISNKGISVKNPRSATKMNFTVSGDNIAEIPDTCFQKKGNSKTVTVDNNSKFCATLPVPQDTQGNIFEDSGNPKIAAAAQKVIKGSPDKNEMIKRMVNFVFRHIKNKNYSHGNLSAGEVLENRSGDCTEHATLLSALLKSAGIPVKMAYGVVLDDKGGFMFHNWNEVYGDNGWMSVDATFGAVKADAARILLIYGGSDSSSREQVSLAVLKFLGSLEISVTGFANE
ncbi:MAG TPA: transglutaminase-like domain-containing protein [bacterium]|nr:transglutaminase-like domain-containing protein [bacterium]HPY15216.1 transglutaminase-like domain-containing protein [bacterium]HQB09466.1 transglutaminase-like domain-containing protein [bacterium]